MHADQPPASGSIRSERLLWVQVGVSFALIAFVLCRFVAPDLTHFIFPWIAQIRLHGFNQPVGNYAPPYLYLLWALSPLPNLVIVKGLAVLGVGLLALAVSALLRSFDISTESAALVPLLPTVLFNGPFIGQCDSYWVAACVMAVATREKPLAMAAWAGLGFAFKAQATFIAPFVLAQVVRRREWRAFAIPPAIYLLAILPAWASGWPLGKLLTIYAGQYAYFDWLSTAPNLWAFPALAMKSPPASWLLLPYALTVAALALYWRRFPTDDLLRAALLSAIIVPFLLPKMHERYFLLADILALCFSVRDRRWSIVLLVQAGSALSLAAYASHLLILNALGSVAMAAALILVALDPAREPHRRLLSRPHTAGRQ